MSDETSESGSPIYRHQERETPWTPPKVEDSCIEAISDHIEKHVGKIDMVWHELVSDLVHIDVHQLKPTPERPYWTLITSGMSDLPMTVPPGSEAHAFAELMICLPENWPMNETHFKDEKNYWPIRWLKYLARFPHEYKTWFGDGHTIPNGDPAEPFTSDAGFNSFMFSRPRTLSTEFWALPVRDDKKVQFFALMPLHPGELALKLKEGAHALEGLFEKHKVTELVDLRRKDLSQRSWWRRW